MHEALVVVEWGEGEQSLAPSAYTNSLVIACSSQLCVCVCACVYVCVCGQNLFRSCSYLLNWDAIQRHISILSKQKEIAKQLKQALHVHTMTPRQLL